ncbi:SigE family RNA polymerase sigma factor [Jiangella ureilytica]|uniref:SigE family RNA polymerase sigma factor n=1 Tax=Jiangella ureilytica TaxID=2530374 RepID=A0A4V6PB12_9ACTN|nr:SigE family RNA polymerase sigma factor [Jiangella ureilytica]TDC48205.1 SigE family RNA polymerase sigma factor [Jiangella ureilytica]
MPPFEDWAHAAGPSLRRVAGLLCDHAADADDLVQETLVKVYLRWSRISRLDNPDAYVRAMLANQHVSMRRSQSRDRRGRRWPGAPAEVSHGEPAVVERSALADALAGLGARQRAVVVLRYYCDLSDEQIADALGCSQRTVRSQASRALARLRTTAAAEELG